MTALAFSSDGAPLVMGGAVQPWDVASQRLLGTELPTSDDAVGRDGAAVYVAGAHIPLQSYPIVPDRAVALVGERAGGGLTKAWWRIYVPDAPYRSICDG